MRSLLLLCALLSGLSFAQAPKLPALDRQVVDQVGILNQGQAEALSNLIYEVHAQGGPQMAIFITASLQDLPIEEFSIRTVEKWQLGSKKGGDGLLILVAPNERQMRIEVGQGIEGEVTDYDASQIVRQVLTPAFKQQAYYEGLNDAVRVIGAKFNVQLPEESGRVRRRSRGGEAPLWLWVVVILMIIFFNRIGPRGPRFYGGGGFGGGGFGGGGFGGGGGSWGGGGGGFSGGGSSGRW